nr:hypothetical protein [Tanacetum cinerariifolium]
MNSAWVLARKLVGAVRGREIPRVIQKVVTCYKCGIQGYYKKDCLKLKNKNHGNQAGNGEAHARAYALGGNKPNPNSNVVTDDSYDVELANGRITGVNTTIWGCTLNLLNHPFNINLMPVELGSFDAIIGMDWLSFYHTVTVCDEKIVRVPFGNETLIIHGDGSNHGSESRLSIISCTKTQKGEATSGCTSCSRFLRVLPEDLPGVPSTRQVEFQIDLIPGAAPVARAPY